MTDPTPWTEIWEKYDLGTPDAAGCLAVSPTRLQLVADVETTNITRGVQEGPLEANQLRLGGIRGYYHADLTPRPECGTCGERSIFVHRCSECGADLEDGGHR